LYLNPNKLIYVSCNPSTLARDLKVITESGKYEVKKVCPVDMFPQTYHIETVVLLIKK
jgi:23S rRNA (uracil1939-C5)-methyltransferase